MKESFMSPDEVNESFTSPPRLRGASPRTTRLGDADAFRAGLLAPITRLSDGD
jgi:hypothetical protein